jgi:hypothetical protein
MAYEERRTDVETLGDQLRQQAQEAKERKDAKEAKDLDKLTER